MVLSLLCKLRSPKTYFPSPKRSRGWKPNWRMQSVDGIFYLAYQSQRRDDALHLWMESLPKLLPS